MAKKLAAIYPRKSRENAVTLEGQINACIEWCVRNDVDYDIFAEEGSASSEDWNRPKLQEMIKKIENLEYNLVVVTEQTRICRDDNFPIFKEILRETETLFVTADTNGIFDYSNPDDELKSDILQAVGKNELSRTKIRLKRGTVQSAKKGNYQGKKPPVGYDYDYRTKRLKLNEDAPVVRKMFELYLEGKSTVEIEHIFNHDTVLAYHKVKGEMVPITWGKSTIARCLKKVVYAGHSLFGKTKLKKIRGKKEQIKTEEEDHIFVRDTHEAIVTDEEWNMVQEMMDKKRTQPPAMRHAKHIFSGLIVCSKCGKVHTFSTQVGNKNLWRIASCSTRIWAEDFSSYKMCGNSGCHLSIVEKLFFASLNGIEKNLKEYVHLINTKELSDDEKQKKKEEKKKIMLLQIDKLKKKRKKILQWIEEGDMYEDDEEIEKIKETKEMQNQIKVLEKEFAEMNQKEQESETVQVEKVLEKIKMFTQGNSDMDEREQNEILTDFIDKIVYSKKGKDAEVEIEIYLKEEIQEILNGI
jgi:site-specific DNA recombinase